MIEYLQQNLDTKFPSYINQNKILSFDQNFECGNIDSVYLHNTEEYNILMKVDTNTRGNTYWFYFKVSNFRIGQRYTFNIYNFTRNLDKFYQAGMNVLTMAEDAYHPTANFLRKKEKQQTDNEIKLKVDDEYSESKNSSIKLKESINKDDI